MTNEDCLHLFESRLREADLAYKTVSSHERGARLFLIDYLAGEGIWSTEAGVSVVEDFLGNWLIYSYELSSKTLLTDSARGIKRFYQCMAKEELVEESLCRAVRELIQEHIDEWVDAMVLYDRRRTLSHLRELLATQ